MRYYATLSCCVPRDNLLEAREEQIFYASKHRREVVFQVDYLVMLKTDGRPSNLHERLPAKWRSRVMGPLRVLGRVGEVGYRI